MYHAVEAMFEVQFWNPILGQTSQLYHVDEVVAVLASVRLMSTFLSEDEPQQFFTWRCVGLVNL